MTDRESIAVGHFTGREDEARTLRDQLTREPAKVRNHNNDRFVQSGDRMLISLARTDGAPVFDLIGETNYHPMPDYIARACILGVQNIRNQMIMTNKRAERLALS